MKYVITFVCLLATALCFSQQKTQINLVLKKQLDSIATEDARYRNLTTNLDNGSTRDSLARVFHCSPDSLFDFLMARQLPIDTTNLHYVENIIKQYGYPGKSLVGTPTNEAAFYVIQHTWKIKEYLPLLRKAANAKELPMTTVAMMEDRALTDEQKEQIYGTQVWGTQVRDSVTGIVGPVWYFNPIIDPKNVNKRRREAGFPNTIEAYAKEMGVPYVIKRPFWWR